MDSRRKFVARIALLPLIAGLSYELIRFAAKRQGSCMALADRARAVAAAHHHQAAFGRRSGGRDPCSGGAMALEARQGGELVIA